MKKLNKRNLKYGIVIPVANEADTINEFCQRLIKRTKSLKIKAEIFFVVDDFSKDNTQKLLAKNTRNYPQIHVVYEPKNRHVVDAYIKGFKEALDKGCDRIIEMDCGFSHLPEELDKFTKGFSEGFDCVFGARPLSSLSYKVPLIRRIYSLGGTVLSNFLLGTKYKDMTSGYEAFTRKVMDEVLKKPFISVGHFYQTEMKYRCRSYKYKEVDITYSFPSNRVGKKSLLNSFYTLGWYFLQRLKFKD